VGLVDFIYQDTAGYIADEKCDEATKWLTLAPQAGVGYIWSKRVRLSIRVRDLKSPYHCGKGF